MEELLRVVEVDAFIQYSDQMNPLTVIQCYLEDGRYFNLYLVPLEIVIALNKIRGHGVENNRETLFELLTMFEEIGILRERIEKVVVDEVSEETHLYTAKVYIKGQGFTFAKRMVPSHAIFLALLIGAPVYVSKDLVDSQEESENLGEKV